MISIMFRGASDAPVLADGPSFINPTSHASATINGARVRKPRTTTSDTMMGSCSPAARERVRDAAYDALEKVLNSLFQPLSPQALSTQWNKAADAMAKHLETNNIGRQ
jgi:hypothetical protein